ncbi:hypothetical protein [Burkholderia savannae]
MLALFTLIALNAKLSSLKIR